MFLHFKTRDRKLSSLNTKNIRIKAKIVGLNFRFFKTFKVQSPNHRVERLCKVNKYHVEFIVFRTRFISYLTRANMLSIVPRFDRKPLCDCG